MPSNANATSALAQETRQNPVEAWEHDAAHEAAEEAGYRPGVTKNVGTVDRIVRVTLGGALVSWAAVRLLGGGGAVALLADLALIALGLDFVVTGIRGHCPLYERLGWSTVEHRARR